MAACGGRERATLPPPQPLSLLLLDPAEGALLRVPTLAVRGKVGGGPAVLGLNGHLVPLAADGGFSTNMTLVEGPNRLVFDVWPEPVTGRGSALLPNTPPALHLVRSVQFAWPELTVRFTAPAEGSVVHASPARVSGLVSEAGAALTVNGSATAVDASGRFETPVELLPGINTVQAEAIAPGGRKARADLRIEYSQPAAPGVKLTLPAEGFLSREAEVRVEGTVAGAITVLRVQGQTVVPGPGASFSTVLKPGEGPLTIRAEAVGLDGQVHWDERHGTIDRTPPQISMAGSRSARVSLTQLPLVGNVIDASPCLLWVAGAATPLDANRQFSTSLALVEGLNRVPLKAVDAAGNQGLLEFEVVRDTLGPEILLDAPLPTTTQEATVTVRGRLVDPSGVQAFSAAGTAQPYPDNLFTFPWGLGPGLNSITLFARDTLGNPSQLTLAVQLDVPPPPPGSLTLAVTTPEEGQRFSQPRAGFAGRVNDPGATVTVNGYRQAVQSDGSFAGELPLTEGTNVLRFLATTVAGVAAEAVRTVTFDPVGDVGHAPVITFDHPRDGHATSAKSITLKGRVDDPKSAFRVQGRAVQLDESGRFEVPVVADREGVLGIRAEATNAHGTGRNALYVSFQWSGLTMAWAAPTPVEGARVRSRSVPAAVTLSRTALVDINGQAGVLETTDGSLHPFRAEASLEVEEGVVQLTATAVDAAGNRASLARSIAVGLTPPTLTFFDPGFDPSGTFRTLSPGVEIRGEVFAKESAGPLTMTLNGQAVPLDPQGRFSWVLAGLAYGPNPLRARVVDAFGLATSLERTIERIQDAGGDLEPRILVERPLEGFATGSSTVPVQGRVNQAGLTVNVQGRAVFVDPLTLRFSATADLVPGANSLVARAHDAQGRIGTVTVHGTRFTPGEAKLRWDLPAPGARLSSRTVQVRGQVDLPGVTAVTVNGSPMLLSGSGAEGAFQGAVVLPKGPQALLLEASTLVGEHLSERRDVIIDLPLPRLVLSVPDSARPGEDITLSVQPAPGTRLVSADLSWNGALISHLVEPFAPVKATVPAAATSGDRIRVEAIGRDAEGETVTARAYVVVLAGGAGGGGPLVLSAFDDRSGLPLAQASAFLDGFPAPLDLGGEGRATLPALAPGAWVRLARTGYSPVWRRGDQLGSKPLSLFDARPTPLDPGQDAAVTGFGGSFAQGAYRLVIPSGALAAAAKVSATALTTQGLPGLLPKGWSAVAALWLQIDGASLAAPASLALDLTASTPASGLAWARWDETRRSWTCLGVDPARNALPVPMAGGFALVAPDPGMVPAEAGKDLPGTTDGGWRSGLGAQGVVDPALLPTVQAINGVRATARLDLAFGGGTPVASGTGLLAEVVETYTLLDLSLIEPQKRVQDAVACRFVLGVDGGAPTLRSAGDGLALDLPVRMSRTFGTAELVDGLIQVGFYHEYQVVAVGGELIGPGGGSINRDGVTVGFEAGSFASATLVRVQGDPAGSWESLWPELKDQGRVAASFNVEITGTLSKGMDLSLADLGAVPAGAAPILVQRRIAADQRVLVVVGALEAVTDGWNLSRPAESNPILEGGNFAVLVPSRPWAWVTGAVSMPAVLAQAMDADGRRFKDRKPSFTAVHPRPLQAHPVLPSGDVAVRDALVSGNMIPAVSGPDGVFALPAFAPAAGRLAITGSRWDLGLTGALEVALPSSGNALRLTTIPFSIAAILPLEGAELETSAVFTVLTSTPMDPGSLSGVSLLQGTVGVPLRRQLSLDGRTLLLTPEGSLAPGAAFTLVVDGLRSLAGEVAPRTERHVTTTALPPPPAECDFSRITLGYPDAAFNVVMTIPAGAIPAGAAILVEGLGMGFSHTGIMPQAELKLTVRASLGERFKLTVQIGGRTSEGFASRYDAGDGRVTVGVDGGRVEAGDGSGAAVLWPVGALERPVEFTLAHSTARPDGMHPDHANEKVAGVLNLRFNGELAYRIRPLWEFPKPTSDLNTRPRPNGLGPYGVYVKVDGFEDDGSPSSTWELQDSARYVDGRLRSFGGFPEVDWEGWILEGAKAAGRTATRPGRIRGKAGAAAPDILDTVSAGLTALAVDSGEHVLSGQVDRLLVALQEQKPQPGAFVFVAGLSSGPGAVKRAGRLVQRTDARGRYLVMSSQVEELIRGGARLMAVDPDYGVTAQATSSAVLLAGAYGSLYKADLLVLKVSPSDQEDRIAPWAELNFEGSDVLGSSEALYQDTQVMDVHAVVNGYDNRSKGNLRVEIRVDGAAVDPALVKVTRAGASGKWRAALVRLQPGMHTVEARVEDGNRNQTRLQRVLSVLAFGAAPAIDPSRPPGFAIEVEGGLEGALPEAGIRVTFNEPVAGVSAQSLLLERQVGADSWAEVTARRISNQGPLPLPEFTPQQVHTVYLEPSARLEVGGLYRVRGTPAIRDLDSPSKALNSPPVEFRVANWTDLGTYGIPGAIRRVAVLGGRTFVATSERIHLLRVGGVHPDPAPVPFGATGLEGDFLRQEVNEMKVFRQVPVLGAPVDLLLVTTSPRPGDWQHQGALWAFSACSSQAVPKLLFAVSLGVGASGTAPTLDCRGGYITVGRLGTSVALVSVDAAMRGWLDPAIGNREPGRAVSPAGSNGQAILQPFYLANPEGKYAPHHPGVAMLPPQVDPVGRLVPGLAIVAGFTAGEITRAGKPLRGLPNVILPTDAMGAVQPSLPFLMEAGHPAGLEPDQRVQPGPLAGEAAGMRVAVAEVQVLQGDGSLRRTSLALAWTAADSGFGGNSLAIVDESDPQVPVYLGRWPREPLGTNADGTPQAYQLAFVTPSVDPVTGLVAVPVVVTASGRTAWYVLDLARPREPRTVARIESGSHFGSFHNGLLSTATRLPGGGDAVAIRRVLAGVPGVDTGECYTFEPKVEIAMDGDRNGAIDFNNPRDCGKEASYLFWVNDDYDYQHWSFEGDYLVTRVPVEDDLPADGSVYLSVAETASKSVKPNCDREPGESIQCKRDLEDFTRLHLRVDAATANLSAMTYWLRFENATNVAPALNLFEAVRSDEKYLKNTGDAEDQLKKGMLLTVDSKEVQVPSHLVKPDGQVMPFLLEGRRAGAGDLVLIARCAGAEIARSSIRLTLKEPSEFCETFEVNTTVGDQVQTVAIQKGPYTYTPKNNGEYVLYVHGWNMHEHEKDRWTQTVFKRLWWLGYKGHVGAFQWPTLTSFTGLTTYDQSEQRAWNSGEALKTLLMKLKRDHQGGIRIFAHSMGNVVMGQTLKELKEIKETMYGYIAVQGAISTRFYDNNSNNIQQNWFKVRLGIGWIDTPDIFGHYPEGKTNDSYLNECQNQIEKKRIFNYYNQEDYALDKWISNNLLKPGENSGYAYEDFDGDINTYHPNPDQPALGDVFRSYVQFLTLPKDRFEIFSRCAQSRSTALGATSEVIQFNGFDLSKEPIWYDSWHYSHSREFRSNIIAERDFWVQVGDHFEIIKK